MVQCFRKKNISVTSQRARKYDGCILALFYSVNRKPAVMQLHKKPRLSKKETTIIMNGMKNWITNGNSASVYLVMAQTNAAKGIQGN